VAQAPPDGHTLLYTFSGTFTQNPHLFATIPYDPFRDFTPISLGARGPLVLVAHASLPARDVNELVAYAKTRPDPINFASFGTGTSSHVFAELFARQAGIAATHVPYKGGSDAAKDLLAGRVQLMFDAAPSALQHARSGNVRILAVASEARSPFLPDVPTFAELGYRDLDIVGGVGFFGPARLPSTTVAKLNAALKTALASREVRDGFANGAYEAVGSSPESLDDLMKRGHERWGRLVRQLGMSPN
jgi:tripartite-type tricarboxylate transporter receptor subunit TctC